MKHDIYVPPNQYAGIEVEELRKQIASFPRNREYLESLVTQGPTNTHSIGNYELLKLILRYLETTDGSAELLSTEILNFILLSHQGQHYPILEVNRFFDAALEQTQLGELEETQDGIHSQIYKSMYSFLRYSRIAETSAIAPIEEVVDTLKTGLKAGDVIFCSKHTFEQLNTFPDFEEVFKLHKCVFQKYQNGTNCLMVGRPKCAGQLLPIYPVYYMDVYLPETGTIGEES